MELGYNYGKVHHGDPGRRPRYNTRDLMVWQHGLPSFECRRTCQDRIRMPHLSNGGRLIIQSSLLPVDLEGLCHSCNRTPLRAASRGASMPRDPSATNEQSTRLLFSSPPRKHYRHGLQLIHIHRVSPVSPNILTVGILHHSPPAHREAGGLSLQPPPLSSSSFTRRTGKVPQRAPRKQILGRYAEGSSSPRLSGSK